jgi:heme/copper-type cytochrome/quinol oxidase subunit 2
VGVSLGAIVVATRAGTGTEPGVSPQVLATLPSVTTMDTRFTPAVVNAHADQPVALRLDNRDGVPHIFTIAALNVDIFMPAGKSVLALFVPSKASTYTISCSFHPAMRATLTVSP